MPKPTSGPDELRADLALAIERGEFRLEYQPVVRLGGGQVAGAEALIRWRHPARGVVPPGQFIPVAEKSGLIVALGRSLTLKSTSTMSAEPATGVVSKSTVSR